MYIKHSQQMEFGVGDPSPPQIGSPPDTYYSGPPPFGGRHLWEFFFSGGGAVWERWVNLGKVVSWWSPIREYGMGMWGGGLGVVSLD